MLCKHLLTAAATAALAACSTSHGDTISADVGLGEAVRYNAAIQTVNPDPVYAEGSVLPGADGDVGRSAVERYRKGQVKDVEDVSTQSSSSGGGSR